MGNFPAGAGSVQESDAGNGYRNRTAAAGKSRKKRRIFWTPGLTDQSLLLRYDALDSRLMADWIDRMVLKIKNLVIERSKVVLRFIVKGA